MYYPEPTYMDETLYGDFSAAAFMINQKASCIQSLNYAHTLSKGLLKLAFKIGARALDPSHPDFSDYDKINSLFERLKIARDPFVLRCNVINISSPIIEARLKEIEDLEQRGWDNYLSYLECAQQEHLFTHGFDH